MKTNFIDMQNVIIYYILHLWITQLHNHMQQKAKTFDMRQQLMGWGLGVWG